MWEFALSDIELIVVLNRQYAFRCFLIALTYEAKGSHSFEKKFSKNTEDRRNDSSRLRRIAHFIVVMRLHE